MTILVPLIPRSGQSEFCGRDALDAYYKPRQATFLLLVNYAAENLLSHSFSGQGCSSLGDLLALWQYALRGTLAPLAAVTAQSQLRDLALQQP